MDATQAAQNALECVLEAKKGEKLIIFCDDTRVEIGKAFETGAKNLQLKTKLILFKTEPQTFRKEIPANLIEYLTTERADIYINLFRGIREETPFRIKLIHAETCDGKTRLGHCPGVTLDMLTKGALAVTVEEHRQMQNFAKALMWKLGKAVKLKITTPAGTKLSLSVEGRPFITDTEIDWKRMSWMNLPTGEVYAGPVEDSLEGKLVCDVAIGGIGTLKAPVTLKVKRGMVDAVTSENLEVLKRVQDSLHTDTMAKVVGEFAFGINPKARFVDEFLEAEKMRGTVHIAFGDNTDMPNGKNSSANHMDFMMDKPTVKAIMEDGSVVSLLVDGKYQDDEPIEEPTSKIDEEKLPVSKVYKVVDYTTLFKTDLWWEAIVVFETYGKRQMGMYLWQKRNGVWKRKNKFGIRSLEEWSKLRSAIDQLAPRLAERTGND
jgi:leucyl aminopeptidase (aminopeptidase T)